MSTMTEEHERTAEQHQKQIEELTAKLNLAVKDNLELVQTSKRAEERHLQQI